MREDNIPKNQTYIYTYDTSGNILSKKTYALTASGVTPSGSYTTVSYGYSTGEWGDLLTSYAGYAITYDAIGNPLSYRGKTFTWEGRQLVKSVSGSTTLTFKYNDEGIRTSKTVNGVTTNYYLSGSQIVGEETNGNITVYLYNSMGIIGFQYHGSSYAANTWDTYFYEKNLQGDIVAVYDASGSKKISYTYDAWGNFTATYHNGATASSLKNPYTYRGYYYDNDLGIYYLNARYYDSTTHRFVNADAFDVITATPEALTDKNLYAYCDNNPVMRTDENGQFWNYVIGGLVGAIAGGILGWQTSQKSDQDPFVATLTGAGLGASAGLIVASGNISLISSGVSSVASKATTDIIGATMYGTEVGTWEDYAVSFVMGSVTGIVGNFSSSAKMVLDVAARPAINQFVKMGTRGKPFDEEKYAYDVATRLSTYGGSKNILNAKLGDLKLKVDIGKCFYRATTRGIYPYLP